MEEKGQWNGFLMGTVYIAVLAYLLLMPVDLVDDVGRAEISRALHAWDINVAVLLDRIGLGPERLIQQWDWLYDAGVRWFKLNDLWNGQDVVAKNYLSSRIGVLLLTARLLVVRSVIVSEWVVFCLPLTLCLALYGFCERERLKRVFSFPSPIQLAWRIGLTRKSLLMITLCLFWPFVLNSYVLPVLVCLAACVTGTLVGRLQKQI